MPRCEMYGFDKSLIRKEFRTRKPGAPILSRSKRNAVEIALKETCSQESKAYKRFVSDSNMTRRGRK